MTIQEMNQLSSLLIQFNLEVAPDKVANTTSKYDVEGAIDIILKAVNESMESID